MWGQEQWCALRCDNVRRVQRFFPEIAKLSGQLPMSAQQELCGRSSKSQQMSILSATEMSSSRHEQRW